MSRRNQPVIEEFDDDTDLPLPSKPLPNTGALGALLQSVDSDSEDDLSGEADVRMRQGPGPATPSQNQFGAQPRSRLDASVPTVSDITPYKRWTCIYPIYLDAKRPFGTGTRRIAREKAVWWPLSKDIADATSRLGLSTLHEVQKCHPQDWENPGRVRVQWKKDGRLVNSQIRTKKQLLEAIAVYIHSVKPELIPRPPFTDSPPQDAETTPSAPPSSKPIAPTSKGTKSSATSKSKATSKQKHTDAEPKRHPRLPRPPEPRPPLATRVSAYSPVLSSGVLVETLKAGLSSGADGAGPGALPGGKGKRKVVRVRG